MKIASIHIFRPSSQLRNVQLPGLKVFLLTTSFSANLGNCKVIKNPILTIHYDGLQSIGIVNL